MKGKWIWINTQIEEDTYGEFKTDFVWSGKKTILKLSADSEYAVFINGKFIYGGQYADFPWYKVYDTIDITNHLKIGKNECLIWVWYCGDENFCHFIHHSALRFSIECDGEVVVESNENTLCRTLPYFSSGLKKLITMQLGYTFNIDFTQEKETYRKSTIVLKDMLTQLEERPISLLRILPKVTAREISKNIYDLGEETVGFPWLILKTQKNKKVTISFGEWLDNKKVPRIIGIRDFSFSIIGDGNEHIVFNPLRKLGCRYFEVDGSAEIVEIGLIPTVYPFEDHIVEIDSALHRKIYDVSVRTLKLNAMEHYYDCPWREQGFYALDSRLQMRYGYLAFNNYEYPYAALKLMSEDRNAEGMISIVVPTSHKVVIPSFALFYVVAMEEYASITGDLRLISEYFQKMQGIIERFAKNIKNGLIQNFFGDNYWNFYEWTPGLDKSLLNQDSALNLTFLLSLKSFLAICDMLEKTFEKEKYLTLYTNIAKEINTRYYDEIKGLYRFTENDNTFYALVNAYAILTGVADKKKAEKLCDKLASNELVDCTLSMLSFKYDALLATNHEKYKDFVLTEIDRNYQYMLDNGATSFWETLKGEKDFDGAGSLCHGWSALPIYYYHKIGVVKNVES